MVHAYNEAVDVCQRVTLHVIKPLIIKRGIDTLQMISDGLQLSVTAADNNMTHTLLSDYISSSVRITLDDSAAVVVNFAPQTTHA